ncbi:MAG TPA: aminotransferase class III-fold pyridoxal phosphate-dependent enzyme [Gemmatimonadaceae bacterium]|nr:aminotransferase class III-fold pyridoxal phosphate-dependent enzyme [Gemmatimonadaceae bacterium]
MVFRRLFGRSDAPAQEPPADLPQADEEQDEELGEPEAIDAEWADRIDWRGRAAAVLPTGSSTGSKRPEALYGRTDAEGPTHFIRANGCRVVDADEQEYIDCTMALGAVALGYAEARVTQAVIGAASAGNVSGLASVREVVLAERLCDVIPCAERVQFLKSGAEAMSAAVRIARVHTGREVVVGSGYFGWHDWSQDAAGVPAGVRGDFVRVPFEDVEALERAVGQAGSRLAAVVLEPVIERLPAPEWAARARALCDRAGAVLIFDEMKTGFRLRTGGYQELSGVMPDLAAFGKALANGYPLAAVVGREAVMEAAGRTWISSTLASEETALAAALAVLDWHGEADICEALARSGREMRAAVDAAIEASGVAGVRTEGIDPMWLLRFDEPAHETRFLELAAAGGALFKRGAYNFGSVAHDEDVIRELEGVASEAFVRLRDELASGR